MAALLQEALLDCSVPAPPPHPCQYKTVMGVYGPWGHSFACSSPKPAGLPPPGQRPAGEAEAQTGRVTQREGAPGIPPSSLSDAASQAQAGQSLCPFNTQTSLCVSCWTELYAHTNTLPDPTTSLLLSAPTKPRPWAVVKCCPPSKAVAGASPSASRILGTHRRRGTGPLWTLAMAPGRPLSWGGSQGSRF